jgi:ABC-type iron transport system FetAB permease component
MAGCRHDCTAGFLVLLVASVAQLFRRKLRINPAMVWAAGAQLVTGIALSAPLGRDHDLNPAKLTVKLVVALMIFAMTFFSRKRESVNIGHFLAIIVLTLGNASVAVFW